MRSGNLILHTLCEHMVLTNLFRKDLFHKDGFCLKTIVSLKKSFLKKFFLKNISLKNISLKNISLEKIENIYPVVLWTLEYSRFSYPFRILPESLRSSGHDLKEICRPTHHSERIFQPPRFI